MAKSQSDLEENNTAVTFPSWVMNTGFITGLVLAGLCLVLAAYYMVNFQNLSSAGINQVVTRTLNKNSGAQKLSADSNDYAMIRVALATNMYIARILLLSCGIFTGLAFGFMGFSLFLIGVKGNVDATLNAADKYKLQVARLSPGLFVILCASILIGVCATRSLPVDLNQRSEDGLSLRILKGDTTKRSGLDKPDTAMPGK